MFEAISSLKLFQGFDADEAEIILKETNYNVKNYSKGEIIAMKEDKADYLLILGSGMVSTELSNVLGKLIKVKVIKAPFVLAPAPVFSERNTYPVTISAHTDATLFRIHRDSLFTLFQKYSRFLNNFLREISNNVDYLADKMEFLFFNTIKEKLAYYLLNLYHATQSNEIILPLSVEELSELFGVERPSLSRELSRLTKDGIIERKSDRVIIKDRCRLVLLVDSDLY